MQFRLFAPYTASVDLLGSWSSDPVPMRQDDRGEWCVDVPLVDGRHGYKFRLPSLSPFLDGAVVEITDPQARLVDEWDGDKSVIVVKDGRDVTVDPDFAWRHDDVPLPQDHELTIYELHIAEFGWAGDRPGTFATAAARLDYLRDLGVTAVEFMPIAAFPGDKAGGYNIRHPFAVENVYGGPADLKRFVDECHARGMRAIMDLVLNHTETESSLTKIDFHYWFRNDREGEQSFGPKFDYERVDAKLDLMPARRYAQEIAAYWLGEYHLDGYRLDATAILDNFDLVGEVRAIANDRSGGKPVYIVAEQLPEDPATATGDGPADGAWHQRFETSVVPILCEEPGASVAALAEALQPRNHGYALPALVVNYIESHDEFTLMQRLAERGIFEDKAFRKNKLGATLLFTAVGNPMIYQGQEFGGHRRRDLEIRPLQWDLLDGDYGLHLKEHYAFLARTRRDSPALKGDELALLHVDEAAGVLAYQRGPAEVVIVANLRDDERALTVPFPAGNWRELTFGYDIEVPDNIMTDSFPASSAKIYVRSQPR
ncbi:MAG: alpha-amylase family glycosyl hydrolase [Thermomicrobiales bacterium]